MSENTKQDFPLFSFLALMTLRCVHVLRPLGELNPPEYVIRTGGGLFNPTKGKHVLKRAESHRCDGNLLAI